MGPPILFDEWLEKTVLSQGKRATRSDPLDIAFTVLREKCYFDKETTVAAPRAAMSADSYSTALAVASGLRAGIEPRPEKWVKMG